MFLWVLQGAHDEFRSFQQQKRLFSMMQFGRTTSPEDQAAEKTETALDEVNAQFASMPGFGLNSRQQIYFFTETILSFLYGDDSPIIKFARNVNRWRVFALYDLCLSLDWCSFLVIKVWIYANIHLRYFLFSWRSKNVFSCRLTCVRVFYGDLWKVRHPHFFNGIVFRLFGRAAAGCLK